MMVSSNAKRRSRLGDPKFQYLCGFPGAVFVVPRAEFAEIVLVLVLEESKCSHIPLHTLTLLVAECMSISYSRTPIDSTGTQSG